MFDLRLKVPFTLIVSGPSGCGKTHLVEKLISNNACFTEPIQEIVWSHSHLTDQSELKKRLLAKGLDISFTENFPEDRLLKKTLFRNSGPKLLVLDDIFTGPVQNKSLTDLFNIISHHQNISVILIVQNLHGLTRNQQSCLGALLRSCKYVALFVNRRMSPVIKQLALHYFPGENHKLFTPFKQLLQSYEKYQYLMLDFDCEDPKYVVREGGLLPEHTCYIYEDEDGSEASDSKRSKEGNRTAVKV